MATTAAFRRWHYEADLPTQADDGSWYDAETGFPFIARKIVAAAKNPLAKRTAGELKKMLTRRVEGARISIDRSSLELPLLVDFVADFDSTNKITKTIAIALIDQCSDADREANSLR